MVGRSSPSRSWLVAVALVLSVCAVNVLVVVPLAIAGLVIMPRSVDPGPKVLTDTNIA